MKYVLYAYLKRHLKIALLFTLYTAIFLLIFSLYDLPADAILYSFVLSLFLTLVFFLYGFTKYYQTHAMLMRVKNQITLTDENLPDAKDLLVQDYQLIINTLYNAFQKLESESDYTRSEMIDYYTLWVHQIKTPIAALYLVLESDPSEKNLSMKSELFKIEQYVEMVLHYLRLESETSDLRIEAYDLDAMLKTSIRKYRTIFIEKGIRLNYIETDLKVITDEKWFGFAFEQILSNALKYTPSGEITIALSKVNPRYLEISDTGIGIQTDDLPRVFDKGFTGYNGRMDKKSTGIGLYLCKRALSKLSHDIKIHSEVAVGTTVSIDLYRNTPFVE